MTRLRHRQPDSRLTAEEHLNDLLSRMGSAAASAAIVYPWQHTRIVWTTPVHSHRELTTPLPACPPLATRSNPNQRQATPATMPDQIAIVVFAIFMSVIGAIVVFCCCGLAIQSSGGTVEERRAAAQHMRRDEAWLAELAGRLRNDAAFRQRALEHKDGAEGRPGSFTGVQISLEEAALFLCTEEYLVRYFDAQEDAQRNARRAAAGLPPGIVEPPRRR